MEDLRRSRRKVCAESAAMNAAFFAALMPLFIALRHVVAGDGFAHGHPSAFAWVLAGAGAWPVMMIMGRFIRRLPAENERAPGQRRRPLTKELTAALAVGYATLTGTGGLVVVFAIDGSLAGGRVGPVYAYALAATVSIGAAILVGRRCFRRLRTRLP